MLVTVDPQFRFTRRSFLQTGTAACASPAMSALPVVGPVAKVASKSIESLGITILNCVRNPGKRLLGTLSHYSYHGALYARILLDGSPYLPGYFYEDVSDLRKRLFNRGKDIIDLFNENEEDILAFIEAVPPEEVLKAHDFFNLPDDSVTWTPELKMIRINPRLDENKKQFVQNPEVHRYIEAGKFFPKGLGKMSTQEIAELLFKNIQRETEDLYQYHFEIAKFLQMIRRGNISVKNSPVILRLLGNKYKPFYEIVTRCLIAETRSQKEADVNYWGQLKREGARNQNRLKRQDSSKIADSKQEPKLEVDKHQNFLSIKDRQVLAGVYNTAMGRFLREEADGQTIGELCFDLNLDPQFQSYSYETVIQAAIEAGITNGYKNYEYEF